jgi:ribosomal protein L9
MPAFSWAYPILSKLLDLVRIRGLIEGRSPSLGVYQANFMEADTTTSPAEEVKISVDNMSVEDYVASRLSENVVDDTSSSEEPTQPLGDEGAGGELPEEEPLVDDIEDELPEGNYDLLEASQEELQALVAKSKSRLLNRMFEVKSENKQLKDKIANLESTPVVSQQPQNPNPFAKIESEDLIKAKFQEFEATLRTTDELLEEYRDYSSDDMIVVGDREFPKSDIERANRNSRDALIKYLPDQQQHLAKMKHLQGLSSQYQEMVSKEVPEVADESSEIGKLFRSVLSDPLIAKVKRDIPELGVQVEYLLAHAVRSISHKPTKVQQGAGMKLKVNPPASPVSSGVSPSSSRSRAYNEAMARFEKTGSIEDYVTAQSFKK